jgi:hypothetical protein
MIRESDMTVVIILSHGADNGIHNRFFGSVPKLPTQMGSLSVKTSGLLLHE